MEVSSVSRSKSLAGARAGFEVGERRGQDCVLEAAC